MNLIKKIYFFYYDGFKNMKLGKRLWLIIFIKLVVMFGLLKWLFFPNYLKENFTTDTQRGNYVLEQLTTSKEKINGK